MANDDMVPPADNATADAASAPAPGVLPIADPRPGADAAAGEEETGDSAVRAPAPSAEALRVLEALLFASPEILPPARLKTLIPGQPDGRSIRRMIDGINEQMQRQRHPFEVVEIGGGYQFRTIPYYQPWVQQLFKDRSSRKLSIQALETLAVIAYRQPITKAEVEQIRGVVSDGAMKPLLEKRLVTIVGRSEKAGHPLLYGTTQAFLNYFGINRLDDLPRIEEFEAVARKKMEDLTEEQLRGVEAMAGAAAPSEEGPADDRTEQDFAEIVHRNEGAGDGTENGTPRGATEESSQPQPPDRQSATTP